MIQHKHPLSEAELTKVLKRITMAKAELRRCEHLLYTRCPHLHTEHWNDASGNNGSGTTCLDCGY